MNFHHSFDDVRTSPFADAVLNELFSPNENFVAGLVYVDVRACVLCLSARWMRVWAKCLAMSRLAAWAVWARSARVGRGIIGPMNVRRLGNSPKTREDGTKPSGPSVSFIRFDCKGEQDLTLHGWVIQLKFPVRVAQGLVVSFADTQAVVGLKAGLL